VGAGIYNVTGWRQTRRATLAKGVARVFLIKVENHGAVLGRFRVRGPHGGPALQVGYRTGMGRDITAPVVAGREELLVPGHGTRFICLVVTATLRAWRGLRRSFLVVTAAENGPPRRDAVRARVRVVRHLP
jgi:hypothetical protein